MDQPQKYIGSSFTKLSQKPERQIICNNIVSFQLYVSRVSLTMSWHTKLLVKVWVCHCNQHEPGVFSRHYWQVESVRTELPEAQSFHYSDNLEFNRANQLYFLFKTYWDLLDLTVSACCSIVRLNGCWTMTSCAVPQTGKPHWLDCILLWYYHRPLLVFTERCGYNYVHAMAHTHAQMQKHASKYKWTTIIHGVMKPSYMHTHQ